MVILILDDNPDILMLMRLMVKRILGINDQDILTGRNGVEGISLLADAKIRPEMIISNLRMPDMDGLAFLKELRHHGEWEHIPLIMMSANLPFEIRHEAARYGVGAFLNKPFNLEDVRETISNISPN